MVDEDTKWTLPGEAVTEIRVDIHEEVDNKVERTLAFLDTISVFNSDGSIKTLVFTKHTVQYLNFKINHPLKHTKEE